MAAGSSSSSPRKKKKSGGFLPEGMSALFRQWAWQAGGVAVVALALVLAAALATYHPKDHSLNTAADPGWHTQNMIGLPGAFFADLLLQLVGLAAWLPSLALLLWGGRLMVSGRPMEKLWLRGLLLLSGLFLMAIGLGAVPVPAGLHLPGAGAKHLGGSAGTLLLEGLTSTLMLFGAESFGWVMALFCGALGLVCAVTSLGLSWGEWKAFGRSLRDTFRSWNETRRRIAALPETIREKFARPEQPEQPRDPRNRCWRTSASMARSSRFAPARWSRSMSWNRLPAPRPAASSVWPTISPAPCRRCRCASPPCRAAM